MCAVDWVGGRSGHSIDDSGGGGGFGGDGGFHIRVLSTTIGWSLVGGGMCDCAHNDKQDFLETNHG